MKRILALTFAMILCLCLCAPAYAVTNPKFTQSWTKSGNTYVSVSERVDLSVAEDANNPVSGTTLSLNRDNATGEVSITCPSYSTPGIYKYSITQIAGNSQGATYESGTIGFEVLVSYNNSGSVYIEKTGLSLVDGAKKDSFDNVFSFGNLVITNTVTGNLADVNGTFPITVTLHADKNVTTQINYTVNDGSTVAINGNGWSGDKEIQITGVRNNGTVHFYDLPAGITYTISETGAAGYTVSCSAPTGTIAAAQQSAATITQTKEADINTGISLDVVPFVILLVVVLFGFVLLFVHRRRRERD